MSTSQTRPVAGISVFQIAILFLSLLVLAALAADSLCDLPEAIHRLIQIADTSVCVVLLADFFVRLYRADSKLSFMKWGWIDLVASIPNLDILRWGRLVRVLRIIRLFRGLRSIHRILALVFQNRMQGGAVSLGLMAFLLITFSSVSILICERRGDANIKSAEDAIWWSISTITTVGYGDKYPVTTEGRVVGIILMICGVGMFAGISGLLASVFVGGPDRRPPGTEEILARLDQVQAELELLRREQPNTAGGAKSAPNRSEVPEGGPDDCPGPASHERRPG